MAQPCRGDCEAKQIYPAWLHNRVRERSMAVPTRDREHRLGAEARRQSLSRRSPTAPFAQGRSGGRTAILSLLFCVQPAQRGSAVWERRLAASAAAQYGSSVTLAPPGARKRSGKSRVGTAIFSLVRCPDGHTLFAWVDTTGLRSVAQRGSAVWERRLAAISSYDEITRCQDQKSLYGVFGRLRRSEDSGS